MPHEGYGGRSNRILINKKGGIQLINPWKFLYDFNANRGIPAVVLKRKKPLKEEASVLTSLESGLLELCLNLFNEDPDFEL